MTAGEVAPTARRGDACARDAACAALLHAAGFGAARRAPLAGDASPRRYERLTGGPAPAVLMDADPASGEDVRPFAALALWLRSEGFAAPDVYAADPENGFLLLEDLGDALFARVAEADPDAEPALYEAAVDVLLDLSERRPPPRVAGAGCEAAVAAYDAATLLREARLVVDWWAPAAGAPLSADAGAAFDAALLAAVARPAASRRVLALRDYHAENLVWRGAGAGAARVGLLDFQDALAGHPAYDLVSLLEDARRDVSPDLAAAMTARYAAGARARDTGFDADAFAADAAALAAQRNLKIVGIFARLNRRDGKPRYLSLIPRVWAHLRRDLAHPALAPLRRVVDRLIPEPTAQALAAAAASPGRP